MEMKKCSSFLDLGNTGIYDYCERALTLSSSQCFYFKSVAQKSEEVPQLKKEIVSGNLTLSQARRVVPVVTKNNQALWIEKAKTLSQKELEKAVTLVNPNAYKPKERIKPISEGKSQLTVPVQDKTENEMAKLREFLSQKRQRPVTLEETIAYAIEFTLERVDPELKAVRAVKKEGKQIPEETAKPVTKNRKTVRAPIPAGIKHKVVQRDGWQCGFKS